MVIGTLLHSLVLLGVFSGLPHLPHFSFRHPKPVATAADSLPPPWKTASRLALESQFVMAGLPRLDTEPTSLKVQNDPRQMRVTVDPDSGTIATVTQVGEFEVGPPAEVSFARYAQLSSSQVFHRQWVQRSQQSLASGTTTASTGTATHPGGLSFQFPSPLPTKIQSLLGPGGPALNVSGSENIKLSGTSNWTNQQTTLLGQKASLFPSLDMQQDLNIKLEGQLSDRIRVNLLQNSLNPIPLSNRIAINYHGEEDDLIQEFDLGNTNLTLPNTQYVSYSGRNEGLFGAKSALRYGPLDLTVLASKQEGRSEHATFAGGGAGTNQPHQLADLDYIKGTYYLIYDPNGLTQSIDETTIRVFKDDNNYGTASNKIRGRAMVDPRFLLTDTTQTASVRGSFAQLVPGADRDYEILNNVYGQNFKVIKLHQQLSLDQMLAVTYQYRFLGPDGQPAGPVLNMGGQDADTSFERPMKLLRPPVSLLKSDPNDPNPLDPNFDPDSARAPFNQVRDLEMKNFYDLAGQRIDPLSLKISIEQGQLDPPVWTATLPSGQAIPYIETMGLDNFDESGGTPVFGQHDGKVDGTLVTPNSRVFVDYENGILFFPDLRPFAPRLLGTGARRFEQAIAGTLSRRDTLDSSLGAANAPNSGVYDKFNPQRSVDSRYFIDVQFTAQRTGGDIYLGRSNIVEGSEVVTVNNQQLVRDRDYTIDYDLGRVTLKKQLLPSDNLNIDYAYAPLFQSAGRTLVGSAFNMQGRDKQLGGAFVYESRGAQDLRPRLGEEPSRSVIGDLNTAWDFTPTWLTRMADRLPGVRTTAASQMHVQAEAGMSFPNPNTQNQVFVDDMEGVRDAVSLSMGPDRWRWCSVPSIWDPTLGRGTSLLDFPRADSLLYTEVHWYSPIQAVKEKELKPNLTQAQGAENYRQVLAISLPRRPTGATSTDSLWTGLTYPLDVAGLDVSRSQFIELWVNDWNDYTRVRNRHVRLHIDLGTVSEDQIRAPGQKPDGVLNTEDRNRDNQLTVTDQYNEDTGLDGLLDADEIAQGLPVLDLTTSSAGDPSGDDFHGPDEHFNVIDPRRYRYTNGTEGNKSVNPNPDTEDLNQDFTLNTQEDYIEYTIDLGDTSYVSDSTYLATDVQRESQLGHYPPVASDNGWRRYRIPLYDSRAQRFGNPNLTLAKHVRVWLQGVGDVEPDPATLNEPRPGAATIKPYLVLGSLDIVGNRWQVSDLGTSATASGTTQTLNAINNLDNADVYAPPFEPGQTRSGNQEITRREQSISLEFTRLQPRDSLEAFKTFSLDEDYSRYRALVWYVAAYDVHGAASHDSLRYFVRFSSDEIGTNYYEYSAMLPPFSPARSPGLISWAAATLRLTDISNLKLNKDYHDNDTIPYRYAVPGTSIRYAIKGRPSFTRIRRVSFGLINADTTSSFDSGQLWFDELRANDVAKDVDKAGRMLVNGNVANLLRYSVSMDGRGANFLTVGQSQGTGNSTRAISMGGSVDVHRFFEGTGIVMPATFNYTDNSSKPRFTAGDDVIRTGAVAEASITRSVMRSWNLGYSRVWTERSNAFLRFWLSGLTASVNGASSNSTSPSAVGITRNFGAAVNYSITPRRYLALRVPVTPLHVYPLPERVWWNYSVATNASFSQGRLTDGSIGSVLTDVRGRVAGVDYGADTRPIDILHHHIEAHRNLSLPDPLLEKVGFINFGRVVSWRQNADASYTFARGGDWFRPTLGWNGGYSQANGPELSPDLSIRAIGNGQTVRASWDFPFDRLPGHTGAVRDSTHPPRSALWRRFLGRLGTISADAQFNQSSSFSRMTGTPSFVYLFGLSSDPGISDRGRVAPQFGNQTNKSEDWRTSGRTRVSLLYGSTISVRGDWSARHIDNNEVITRQATQHFPSLEFDYGQVVHALRLDRILRNAQLRSSYDRARTIDYLINSTSPSTISTSASWQPLLGVTGDLRNGARTDFQFERRVTQDENHTLGNSVKTTRNTNVRFNLSRSYTQGQKVNILGKETVVKSSVGLGLTTTYSRDSGEVRILDSSGNVTGVQAPFGTDRLAVNGTGSYGFSTNVTGNVMLGYGQDRDLQRDIVHRNIVVELRASFTF